MLDIFNSYHNTNPYHNFRHAVDVLQSTYYFLCKMGLITPLDPGVHAAFSATRGGTGYACYSSSDDVAQSEMKELLRPIDILALMMACIGHDVGHPGVTNMFMVAAYLSVTINAVIWSKHELHLRSIQAPRWQSFTMTDLSWKAIIPWPFSIC